MPTRLNPYLSFRENAREAMEFYNSVFGGELVLNTFAEFGGADNPADADKIMHAQLEAEGGLVLMGADTPTGQEYTTGTNYSVSLSGEDDAQLRGYWEKLSDGATIVEPLELAPWGDSFGMLVDKYGVSWLVNISGS
ncbi:MAG: hypothetical protein JWP85_1480 [Rhodoglobus sp.]|nr:hypothetical protein [Rhodoglobus sp.]